MPVIAAPASAGAFAIVSLARRRFRRAAVTVCALMGISAFASISGPWIMEEYDYVAELHSCVGYQLSLLGRHEEAERQLRLALESDPRFPSANRLIGCVLHEQGRNEEAIDHFNLALEIEPDSYTIHYYLGVALLNIGRIDDALHHLRRAAEGARSKKDIPVFEQVQRVLEARGQDETPVP
jgi:tetratricopeptide (TPR) repeat protein